MNELAPLRGTVVKLTLRRLKSGRLRHWTRIEFDESASPYRSVALSGELPAVGWDERLLAALREWYDVDGLPEPRWSA